MSAFLSFSQAMRPLIRAEFPGMKNSEVSVVLAQRWKNATDVEKEPHLERERGDRQQYYRDLAVWREAEERIKEETTEESSSTVDFLDLSGKRFWCKVDAKEEGDASSDKTSADEADDEDAICSSMRAAVESSKGQCSQLLELRNSWVVNHNRCDSIVSGYGIDQGASRAENGGGGDCAELSSHASCSTGVTSGAALSSASSSIASSCASSLSSSTKHSGERRRARNSECVPKFATATALSVEGSTDGSEGGASGHRSQSNLDSFSEDAAVGFSDRVHWGLNAYVNYMDNRSGSEMPGDYPDKGQSDSAMMTTAQDDMQVDEADARVTFSFTPEEILDFLAVPTWPSAECAAGVGARDFPAFSVGYEEGLSRTLEAASCAGFYDGVTVTGAGGSVEVGKGEDLHM